MDEGVRCLICIAALLVCCLLQVIITSFKIAIDHINDSDLEDLQQNNPMEAEKLEKYHSDDHLLVISSSFLRIFTGIGIVINSFLLLQDVYSFLCILCRVLFWNGVPGQFQKAL